MARKDTSFRIQQQGKGAASTKFTIFSPESNVAKDEKGAVSDVQKLPTTLISVDGKHSSAEERHIFLDASGPTLFDLYHTPRGTTWHIEVPGGDSPSLVLIEPQYSTMKDDYKVQQFRNAAAADGQNVVLRVQGQDVRKMRTNVLPGDKVVMTTKGLDKLSVYLPGSKAAWQVDVAEGVDMALAAAIVVVMGANMYMHGRSRGRIYSGKE